MLNVNMLAGLDICDNLSDIFLVFDESVGHFEIREGDLVAQQNRVGSRNVESGSVVYSGSDHGLPRLVTCLSNAGRPRVAAGAHDVI